MHDRSRLAREHPGLYQQTYGAEKDQKKKDKEEKKAAALDVACVGATDAVAHTSDRTGGARVRSLHPV